MKNVGKTEKHNKIINIILKIKTMSGAGGVNPADILPENVNSLEINGVVVRKGTVAAVVANIELLEDENSTEQIKEDALNTIKSLIPSLHAQGLTKHVTWKNAVVQALIDA